MNFHNKIFTIFVWKFYQKHLVSLVLKVYLIVQIQEIVFVNIRYYRYEIF